MTEDDRLDPIREELRNKKYACEILSEIENLKETHGIDRFSDKEFRELGYILRSWSVHPNHPLIKLHVGYRYYQNTNSWNCFFCGREIKEREGYWAHKKMKWSEGPKLCHECFLKFLCMFEWNNELYELLDVFIKIDHMPTPYKVILLDKMKSLDFIRIITSVAEHYNDIHKFKGEK